MPDSSSNSFAFARAEAIARLRRDHAFAGAREGGILLDAQSGALVEYVVGDEFSANFDEQKLAALNEAVVFHTHPADRPANEWDWQWLAEHANVREFLVVGPTLVFGVERPEGWQLAVHWRKTPFEDFEAYLINIVIERGFSNALSLDTNEWSFVEREANRRMARQFQMRYFEEFI